MTAAPPECRPYTPWGAAREAWRYRGPECMVGGPAGTGKTRGNLERLLWCAEKYPGMRGLIFRKRRKDLTESGLVTWEEKVLPAGHASLGRIRRENRHSYPFPNGSTVVVGGLDDSGKIMSTEYDLAVGLECRELEEGDWEAVSIRCRNGRMPYQQTVGDTNPDAPGHWIRRRAAAGKLLLLESRHEDNPAYYDRTLGTWTAAGARYLARLDELTGVRRDRLRYGRWSQAEGMVYESWDAAVHLIDPFPIPADWLRYWSVDFGWNHPFVCLFFALDPDGRLYLYREWHRTGMLVEDHARRLLALSAEDPRPRLVICDHDLEDRRTLARHTRLPNVAANKKDVLTGIQMVEARLRKAGDGKPRLMVFKDSLVERDRQLEEAGKPVCLADEMESYVWRRDTGRPKEEPEKVGDDAQDALRYLVAHLDLKAQVEYRKSEAPSTTVVDEAPPGVWGRYG